MNLRNELDSKLYISIKQYIEKSVIPGLYGEQIKNLIS